jgi:ubiquitin C-terminal hydrolase
LFARAVASTDPIFQRAAYKLLLDSMYFPQCESLMASRFERPVGAGRRFSYFSGLCNFGSTCYLNFVLQQLCVSSLFFCVFVNIVFERDDYRRLQELFVQMRFGSQSRNDPSAFIAAWRSVHPGFHEGHQKDALEFFLDVVGSLPTVMTSLFDGQTITELKQING